MLQSNVPQPLVHRRLEVTSLIYGGSQILVHAELYIFYHSYGGKKYFTTSDILSSLFPFSNQIQTSYWHQPKNEHRCSPTHLHSNHISVYWKSGVQFLTQTQISIFITSHHITVELTQLPTQWVLEVLQPGLQKVECEPTTYLHLVLKSENVAIPPLHQALTVWCLTFLWQVVTVPLALTIRNSAFSPRSSIVCFFMIIRINSNYFPKQHELIVLFNGTAVHFV
jgi:hypothetical protein